MALLPHNALVGNALVLYAAMGVAVIHAIAKSLYREGVSVITWHIMRGVIVFSLNLLLTAVVDSPTSALNALLLRVGSRRTFWLAILRGMAAAMGMACLHFSLYSYWQSLADCFTIFNGVGMLATIVLSGFILGAGERLGCLELVCGAAIFGGVILVAQPPILFTTAAPRVSLVGVLMTVLASILDNGLFNVLTRALAMPESPGLSDRRPPLPPSTLLSIHMASFILFFSVLFLGAAYSGLAAQEQWRWLRWTPPTAFEWRLIAASGVMSVTIQHAILAGYARTRAGIAAALNMSELVFAKLLDVVVLRASTNALAGVGTAVVLLSSSTLAYLSSRRDEASDAFEAIRKELDEEEADEERTGLLADVDDDDVGQERAAEGERVVDLPGVAGGGALKSE